MIETLRIEDLAIVDAVTLEFGSGLNVLTGETGAGKSIVLGALGLLAGARTSADIVREGADAAQVEAVFRTAALPELEAELREQGWCDEQEAQEHELIVQRSVASSGRSRARIAGRLVPVARLSALFAGRIEISSQHSSQALLRPEAHARLLDEAGGHTAVRHELEQAFARVRELGAERDRLRHAADERARRIDFLRFEIDEIDAAELQIDELERVDADQRRLAHAEQLREEGGAALALLAGDAVGERSSALDALARAGRLLASLSKLDDRLAPLADRLRAGEDEMRDVASDLERHLDRIEVDPGRLASLEQRLAEIEKLRRKYGDDVPAILGHRDAAASELAGLERADERIASLEGALAQARADLAACAAALTKARKRAARALAKRVQAPLADLALPDARFEVALTPQEASGDPPCGPGGAESVAFLFAASADEAPRPLQRVASGGELSRVFLALKNALRGAGRGMVLVFDEVDAGIGGRTAERVGRCLVDLAAEHQVLCITHHPQIAALAQHHFRVARAGGGGRRLVRVERVEGEVRVDEVARMAGGEVVSDETRRHAQALLRAGTRAAGAPAD